MVIRGGAFELVSGAARRIRLAELGCTPALIAALDEPSTDPVAAACWVAGGDVLATMLDIPYIRDHWMPGGTIVPLCQLAEGSVDFALFVDGALVRCHDEFIKPYAGGLVELLDDRLQWAWETHEELDGATLAAFAVRIGFPMCARVR